MKAERTTIRLAARKFGGVGNLQNDSAGVSRLSRSTGE
jgi:hypothetical protein